MARMHVQRVVVFLPSAIRRDKVVPRKEMMTITSTHMYRNKTKSNPFEIANRELAKAGLNERAKHCIKEPGEY